MTISIHIHEGPLNAEKKSCATNDAGALLCFEGIVRLLENTEKIKGLNYTIYSPMAEQELQKLAEKIVQQHKILALTVEHSRGFVPVGACSFRLQISSPHRREALEAMTQFIDEMKRDVPIWKSAVV